jgi:hypothetical protein
MKTVIKLACGVILLASAFAAPMLAQEDRDPLAAMGKKAYSEPVSNKLVQFEVKLQKADVTVTSVTVGTQEGGMGKILAFQAGFAYALVPLVNAANDTAEFHIFRITRDEQGNESVKEVERLTVQIGETVCTSTDPSLHITLKTVTDAKPAKSAFASGR